METIKLNLGSGRRLIAGFINIDRVQIIDGNGKQIVDKVLDLEKEPIPYEDETITEILADAFLEHISNLKFLMNECHRVLIKGGILSGSVPVAGTDVDFRDPTHKRHFNKNTFMYFTGKADWNNEKPSHPRYADYGFKRWILKSLKQEGDIIYFKLKKPKNEA